MSFKNQFTRRALLKTAGGLAVMSSVSAPSILRAQSSDVIRIGHLTPRTGFLGPLGEYGVMAADLAVEEINASGGVMGRKVELLKEDSVNPQTASTKAERMIERDKVTCIIGEISSASALTIAQVAQRNKTLFINTGANSDALRGSDCKRYMFHVESQNSMYVKSVGRSFMQDGLVKGKKWYSLTADYAFGHDLLRVAKRFMEANGGQFAGDDLVPTDATDFSAYLLKIRDAKPDLVAINLSGNQITNFLKQYAEFGLTFPVGGFGFDTALAWAAGKGNFRRHLAIGLASPDRYRRHQGLRRRLHQEIFQAAGEPGLGRLHRDQDRGAVVQRTEVVGLDQGGRTLREGREVRRAEDPAGLLPCGRSSAHARDVRHHRAAAGEDQEPVGYLHVERPGAWSERGSRGHRSHQGRKHLRLPDVSYRRVLQAQS